MREVKDPEVRKAEIIEAAKNLFYTKGYLHTTTQDIINSLKILGGSFMNEYADLIKENLDTLLSEMDTCSYRFSKTPSLKG